MNNHQKYSKPVGTIIHLGAGQCAELDNYQKLNPEHILLVEADAELAEILTNRTIALPNIEVVSQTLSAESKSVIFNRYNFSELNSIHKASEPLLEIYPGLKLLDETKVHTMSLEEVLHRLELKSELYNILIIDTRGVEFSLLNSIMDNATCYLFDEIRVFHGDQYEYYDQQTKSSVLKSVTDIGFVLVEDKDVIDIIESYWTFYRNNHAIKNNKLDKQLAEQTNQLAEKDKQLVEQTNQLAEKDKQLVEQTNQLAEKDKQLSDYENKIPLMDEEFVKAEAQIELIKDILIREKAF